MNAPLFLFSFTIDLTSIIIIFLVAFILGIFATIKALRQDVNIKRNFFDGLGILIFFGFIGTALLLFIIRSG